MILKVRRLRVLTSPRPAGGWRKGARWGLVGLLALGGMLLGTGHAPVVSLVSAAIAIFGALYINAQLLGGRPERRHAIQRLISLKMTRRWAKAGEAVGPSPATVSLKRLQAEAASTSHI